MGKLNGNVVLEIVVNFADIDIFCTLSNVSYFFHQLFFCRFTSLIINYFLLLKYVIQEIYEIEAKWKKKQLIAFIVTVSVLTTKL